MKFAVVLALASTAAAQVSTGCIDDVANKATATADDACECATGCTLCKGAAAAGATAAAKTAIAADQCYECATATDTITEATAGDVFGTCTAAAGAGAGAAATAGKAAIGALCDSDAEDSGCADGGRCSGVAGAEVCILSELCIDPIPCGALKLGASLAAALAMASYL